MIFTRGGAAQRRGPPLQYEDLFKGLKPPGPVPRVPVPYIFKVDYPTREGWRDVVEKSRESPLRFLDLKGMVKNVVDEFSLPQRAEEVYEKHVEVATDAIIDDERERRERTKDPLGQPSEADEDPDYQRPDIGLKSR